jgi:hypothetical protein
MAQKGIIIYNYKKMNDYTHLQAGTQNKMIRD